jgi:hypothetical protein
LVANASYRQEQKKADVVERLRVLQHVGFFCFRWTLFGRNEEEPHGKKTTETTK